MDSFFVGLICLAIGVFAPLYILQNKREYLNSKFFVAILIADVIACILLGLQFMFDIY